MKRSGNGLHPGTVPRIVGLALFSTLVLAAQQPAAVVAGSVFRDSGFTMPGAEVVVAAKSPARKKEWKTVTDARGEFAVRVPPGPAEYVVSVKAKGYRMLEKTVAVAAEERVDLSLILAPDAGGKR